VNDTPTNPALEAAYAAYQRALREHPGADEQSRSIAVVAAVTAAAEAAFDEGVVAATSAIRPGPLPPVSNPYWGAAEAYLLRRAHS
jgi:hypothetical protein